MNDALADIRQSLELQKDVSCTARLAADEAVLPIIDVEKLLNVAEVAGDVKSRAVIDYDGFTCTVVRVELLYALEAALDELEDACVTNRRAVYLR